MSSRQTELHTIVILTSRSGKFTHQFTLDRATIVATDIAESRFVTLAKQFTVDRATCTLVTPIMAESRSEMNSSQSYHSDPLQG